MNISNNQEQKQSVAPSDLPGIMDTEPSAPVDIPSSSIIPGGDVDKVLEQAERKERALTAEANRIAREAKLLHHDIYKNANPHPLFITLLLICIIGVIWLLYVMFIKPVASGEWIDRQKGHIWFIQHNQFTNKLEVVILSKKGDVVYTGKGKVADYIIKVNGVIGIWDYKDAIVFIEGGGLQRVM